MPGLSRDGTGCPPHGWRRTATASGRHRSSPRSATASLALFPACWPAPGAVLVPRPAAAHEPQPVRRPAHLRLRHSPRSSASASPPRRWPPTFPRFSEWLSGVLQDDRLQPSGRFQALLREHVRALLTGQTQPCTRSRTTTCPSSRCATGWRATGTAHPPDPAEHRELQKRIASEALRTDLAQLPVSRIALIYRAVTDDPRREHRSGDPQPVPPRDRPQPIRGRDAPLAVRRGQRRDTRSGGRSPPNAKSRTSSGSSSARSSTTLSMKKRCPRLGHSTYRADFGIPSLGILIEVKYVTQEQRLQGDREAGT